MEEETRQTNDSDTVEQGKARSFANKKFLIIAGGAAGALIVILAVIFFILPQGQDDDPAAIQVSEDDQVFSGDVEDDADSPEPEDEEGEMLPQTIRSTGEDGAGVKVRDPFSGPMVLSGLITGGNGNNLAIIKTSRATYVVQEGELIEDYWTLKEIREQKVVLEAQDQLFNLSFGTEDLHERGELEMEEAVEDESGEELGDEPAGMEAEPEAEGSHDTSEDVEPEGDITENDRDSTEDGNDTSEETNGEGDTR